MAALPTVSGKGMRISRTGWATAGLGGRASIGVSGRASSLPSTVVVDRTEDADASSGRTHRRHPVNLTAGVTVLRGRGVGE